MDAGGHMYLCSQPNAPTKWPLTARRGGGGAFQYVVSDCRFLLHFSYQTERRLWYH